MSDLPRIGPNELDALGEIVRWQSQGLGRTRPFVWWRKASMLKLAVHGLVTRHPANTEARRGWLVTQAGIDRYRSL
jgi:hypothetical protein